jgi:hypothetical protein
MLLCSLVTISVICSDQINAKKSYDFNGLFEDERYNNLKDRRGLRFGSTSQLVTSHIPGSSIAKREQEENAGEIVKEIVTIIANNLPETSQYYYIKVQPYKYYKSLLLNYFITITSKISNSFVTQYLYSNFDLLIR